MKIGIDGKPRGLSSKERAERQCYMINKYWQDRGIKGIFAYPFKDSKGDWKVYSNAQEATKKK